MGEGGAFALFLAIGGIGIATLIGPIGQAVARKLGAGKSAGPGPGVTTGEMTAERIAVVEERLAELEERLDFAERMLASGQSEPAGRLPRAGEP